MAIVLEARDNHPSGGFPENAHTLGGDMVVVPSSTRRTPSDQCSPRPDVYRQIQFSVIV